MIDSDKSYADWYSLFFNKESAVSHVALSTAKIGKILKNKIGIK